MGAEILKVAFVQKLDCGAQDLQTFSNLVAVNRNHDKVEAPADAPHFTYYERCFVVTEGTTLIKSSQPTKPGVATMGMAGGERAGQVSGTN